MQGRSGPTSKPEFMIAALCAIMSIHFGGFIVSRIYFRYQVCQNRKTDNFSTSSLHGLIVEKTDF